MALSRAPAPADYPPPAPALKRSACWPPYLPVAASATDRALWARVIGHAGCASSSLDPDEWFPVSAEIGKARQEAAAAIAVCASCPVRAECLALSRRHWDIGQHGVWGGLVAGERAVLPRPARDGVPFVSSTNSLLMALRKESAG